MGDQLTDRRGNEVGPAVPRHLELQDHLREVHEIAGPMGLGFAPLGFHPTHTRDQMPWMPKSRYRVMRETLGPGAAYVPFVGRPPAGAVGSSAETGVRVHFRGNAL